MKNSLKIFLPAALIVGAGCAHGRGRTVETAPSRPAWGITSVDIERSPGVPIEQLLAARVPGVMLGRASDGRLTLMIRGPSTLSQAQEPLFVVDGTPLGNAANFLAVNRHDIESIEVLKDAASTALYGIQGAGGVILVKTKGF